MSALVNTQLKNIAFHLTGDLFDKFSNIKIAFLGGFCTARPFVTQLFWPLGLQLLWWTVTSSGLEC